MKTVNNMFMFAVGAAIGAGAYMRLENLSKNKYKVKKNVNNAIDSMANTIK
ncbi:MAG: hypothetical protein PHH51_03220 [Bacilli bacterium]|nr:hypothetical protein [Bacilli bacterium]MDD3896069.1 hypothetical protein [Bacilli bacterium]MDD4407989.1 hypothetical protein [Bacilli bacterium]MDD4706405.1 hypothetical protein [Bacilli bacterium]